MDFLFFDSLIANFHFLRPLWLLCLIPALLLVFYLWRINEISSAWDKAIDSSLLPWLLDKTKNAAQRTPLYLLLIIWTATIVALAGPVWERIPQPVQKRQDAVAIILDLSLSMYATDLEPNRLTVAKRKLLDALEVRREGQTGLIVYAGDAHTVTPLTEDTVTITSLAPSLSPNIMPVFGSNPEAAVELALGLMADINAPTGKLLLITDGIENENVNGIRNLMAGSPYSLSILGIGTAEGAPIPANSGDFLRDDSGNIIVPTLDADRLANLADSLDGRYRDAGLSLSDVEYLLADYDFRNDDSLSDTGENFDIWYENGPWLLLLVLPLCALVFRRGWVLGLLLTVGTGLYPSAPAQAQSFGWKDLWQTRDQQAAELYRNQDAETAATLFESEQWKGSAAYHAGDFETAINSFSQGEDITSLYNLGNAYAKAQMLEQAIQAYDAVLALESDHADALHNKAIVEDLLQEQEQQEQESQNSQNQEEQEQQEQDDSAQSEPDSNESNPQEDGEQQEQETAEQEQQQSEENQEQQQQSDQNQDSQQQNSAVTEDQESLEQWLRRIDDDPGELLQRKFQFEYRRRQMEGRNGNNQQSGNQIW